MKPKPDIRYYIQKRGASHKYEIEIQTEAQTYLIRSGGILKKNGGPGSCTALDADVLYALACADIEDLVGMGE